MFNITDHSLHLLCCYTTLLQPFFRIGAHLVTLIYIRDPFLWRLRSQHQMTRKTQWRLVILYGIKMTKPMWFQDRISSRSKISQQPSNERDFIPISVQRNYMITCLFLQTDWITCPFLQTTPLQLDECLHLRHLFCVYDNESHLFGSFMFSLHK